MDKNVLLAKIVANPTESTWSQVYSTLNLYVVLSVSSEAGTENIVTKGKELLEKIQREYFSLDEKSLNNIKQSIENATADISDKSTLSIVLATVTDEILYIVIAGSGCVVLKRGIKIGTIAEETNGEISAFSGNLTDGDIVALETSGFSKKVPIAKLAAVLEEAQADEISENLAPLIHEEPLGSEAAIVLKYKNGAAKSIVHTEEAQKEEEEKDEPGSVEETPQEEEEKIPSPQEDVEEGFTEPPTERKMPSLKIPNVFRVFGGLGAKKIVILTIVVLILIFVGSIYLERQRTESAQRQAALSQILDPMQKRFDEADALARLNKGLALEEFGTIKTELISKQADFEKGTSERKTLDEFIGRVEAKIGELSAGSTLSNQKLVFDEDVEQTTFKDGRLTAVNSDGKIFILSSGGSVEDEYESDNASPKGIAADDSYIYVLGSEGITQTANSGDTENIVENASDTVAIDIFGSNVYGVSDTVDKYSGSSFSRSDYFTDEVELSEPTGMAIDGSIWLLDEGKVRKFTRGSEDTFTVSGLTKDISGDSQIFTSVDFSDIYILDRESGRIISISKSGEVQNQYVSKELTNASSFAVDENGKKIYVVISSKLYSFDL